eukprot:2903193-Amphidinium_carterae.1
MIRDHIAAFARAAGLYTQVEQVVDPQLAESMGTVAQPATDAPITTSAADAARAGRRPVQRADVHIVDLTGADLFIDVRVTHVPAD